jgi:hypothetical protein
MEKEKENESILLFMDSVSVYQNGDKWISSVERRNTFDEIEIIENREAKKLARAIPKNKLKESSLKPN